MTKAPKLLLTIREACEVLAIGPTTFYKLPIKTVRLTPSKKSTRVPYDALKKYVESLK